MTTNELIDLFEHIRYQLVAFPAGKIQGLPSSVGSAFMLDYKGHTFLMTADHVVNTHDKGVRRLDKTVAIQTNRVRNQNGKFECELVRLTDIEYFSEYTVNINEGTIHETPLFDVAYSILSQKTLSKSFVTAEIECNGATINAGSPKYHLKESCITVPSFDKEYCVFGRIRFDLLEHDSNTFLINEITLKQGLKYIKEDNGYYLLQSPIDFEYEDWAGLSGSAVLDTEGYLIGVACAVNTDGSRLIYVKKIQSLLPLMQASILQLEHPEISKNH